MPLGLAMVSAVAEREGHEVRVLDLLNRSLPYSALDEALSETHYPLVMAGGFAMQVHSMREIIRRVRQHSPGTKVLLGGVGVSDIAEIALDYTGADAVCTQEAEAVLPDILRSVEEGRSFENCLGIVYRDGDKNVRRPGGPVPEDLDALPYPAHHLFDIDGIAPKSFNGWGAVKSMHLITSRGCPFRCTFCINSLLNDKDYREQSYGSSTLGSKKPQRFRSPESVRKEINFLRDRYGITDFHFADEEFVTHKEHLFGICAALKEANVTWSTSARADWASEEKLAAMKGSGCRYVLFGIESGSQTILDSMEKKAKVARAAEGIVNCYKVGLRFWPNMMIGYPGETKETILETVSFCKEMKIPFEASFVTMFPNSKMFHDNKHRVKDWDAYFTKLSSMEFSNTVLMNLTDIPDEELKALKAWAKTECKKTADKDYIINFSSQTEDVTPLPPATGLPVAEVPKMFLAGGKSLAGTDGFEESLRELENLSSPSAPTERIKKALQLSDIEVHPQWEGATLRSTSPVHLQTSTAAWGYSALFPVSKRGKHDLSVGTYWVEIKAKMIQGRAGIGLLLDDGEFIDERIIGIEDDLLTLYFRVPPAGLKGLIIRSGGIPSSAVEVNSIALLAEKDLRQTAPVASSSLLERLRDRFQIGTAS
jgi:radical SAM superfamily enzyme YgiQ (UPF0313 family)